MILQKSLKYDDLKLLLEIITLRKKGTKAVTGVVPFQKVNFCPF